jgi:hypothetical protein
VFSAPIAVSLSLWRVVRTKASLLLTIRHRSTPPRDDPWLSSGLIVSYAASSFPANTTMRLSILEWVVQIDPEARLPAAGVIQFLIDECLSPALIDVANRFGYVAYTNDQSLCAGSV